MPSGFSVWTRYTWDWKVGIAAVKEQKCVGYLRFVDRMDGSKVTELRKAGDVFTPEHQHHYYLYYMDDPGKGCHDLLFTLTDGRGRTLVLHSFRTISPLSNVFVRVMNDVDHVKLEADPNSLKYIRLNEGMAGKPFMQDGPGNIDIYTKVVPGFYLPFAP
jgi:hypothetical protein